MKFVLFWGLCLAFAIAVESFWKQGNAVLEDVEQTKRQSEITEEASVFSLCFINNSGRNLSMSFFVKNQVLLELN